MISMGELMEEAKANRASDVHITPEIAPRMRINGYLETMKYPVFTKEMTEKIFLDILTGQQRERLEKMGEIDFSFSIENLGRYRGNIFRQNGSLSGVFRVLKTNIPDMLDLGLSKEVIQLCKKKKGLILVTGPAGSGKTTTLASMVDYMNTHRNLHILILEDPIEYLHTHKQSIVNQREIGQDSQSYTEAMKAAMREDPDVIVLGEMEDLETIELALHAAETGRLVLSALSSIGAVNTLERLIDIFPPYQQPKIRIQLANVLEAIISRQLVLTSDRQERIPICELMFKNDKIKTCLKENKLSQIPAIMMQSEREGMKTLDQTIFELYQRGRINREEALDYAQNVEELETKLIE